MPASGVLTVSALRAQAIAQTAAYYDQLFSDAPALQKSREHYRHEGEHAAQCRAARSKMTQFFFWTAWAASTERPGTQWSPTPTTGRTSR
jgi:nitric oxide reductase subunit B